MNALVIDDEALVRRFVGAVLREEGWSVTEVTSAEDAFEVLTRAVFVTRQYSRTGECGCKSGSAV